MGLSYLTLLLMTDAEPQQEDINEHEVFLLADHSGAPSTLQASADSTLHGLGHTERRVWNTAEYDDYDEEHHSQRKSPRYFIGGSGSGTNSKQFP